MKYDYSGGGYTVAEQMLETATGESFADYLAQDLLNPLGLDRSTFATAHASMTDLARGCSRRPCAPGSGILSTQVKAAGGLLAHPLDYARLVRLVMHDGLDWRDDLERRIPYADIRHVLTPSHHRDSTLTPCDDTCSVERREVRYRNGIAVGVKEHNQRCIFNQCRDMLGRYALGVKVRRLNGGRGGLPQRFFHGGSQKGFISHFKADRHAGEGIVLFINGVRSWDDGERGAKRLRDELAEAFDEAFL